MNARPHPPVRRRSEAGYNMVMLVMAVTVLNILVAAALPLMSTQIRREKEEELIFRGLQYAEAIHLFHARFQGYPTKLEQLIEVKPRCIRQLWKDPMTADGKWGLIFYGQGTQLHADPNGGNDPNNPQNQGGPQNQGDENTGQGPVDPSTGLNTPKKGDAVAVGPIMGVYSKSPEKSFLLFFQHNRYDEWRFTEDMLRFGSTRNPAKGLSGIGDPGQTVVPNFSTRWLGRPMRFADQQQPQNGTMPDGSTPGGGAGGAPGGAPGGGSGSKPTGSSSSKPFGSP